MATGAESDRRPRDWPIGLRQTTATPTAAFSNPHLGGDGARGARGWWNGQCGDGTPCAASCLGPSASPALRPACRPPRHLSTYLPRFLYGLLAFLSSTSRRSAASTSTSRGCGLPDDLQDQLCTTSSAGALAPNCISQSSCRARLLVQPSDKAAIPRACLSCLASPVCLAVSAVESCWGAGPAQPWFKRASSWLKPGRWFAVQRFLAACG